MGRWAQAQRRGGFSAPIPPSAPGGNEWVVFYDNPTEAGTWTQVDPFPPGVDGIVWHTGPDFDPNTDDGNHTGSSSFAASNTISDATHMTYFFAWALDGNQVSDESPVMPWQSV